MPESRGAKNHRLLLRAAGLALAVPLLLGACGQPGTDVVTPGSGAPSLLTQTTKPSVTGPLVPTAPAPAGGVTLDATLSHTSTQLVATYTVTNSTHHAELVIDRIPATLGSSRVETDTLDPEHAWVLMADGRVRVTKQAFPITPDTRFVAEPAIGAHVLQPGASLTGTAVVPLPPTLDVPGEEFTVPRTAIDPNATEWQFCVQVATVAQPRDIVPVSEVADGPLLCSPPARLPAR